MHRLPIPQFLLLLSLFVVSVSGAGAQPQKIESLTATITPANAVQLRALACRNFKHVVHVDITVDWPEDKSDVETGNYGRLIFWDDKAEYLFPEGSYHGDHGRYKISGWFKAVDGGMHAGMISDAFEAPPSGIATPPVNGVDTPTTSTACATKTW